jgi:acetyl esterase/lipase
MTISTTLCALCTTMRAVDDLTAVWRAVVADRPAAGVALGGTSAGANIVLATLLRLVALGVDRPGAVMLGTPACDITKTGDTWFTNAGLDHTLVAWEGVPAAGAAMYTGDLPPDDLDVSPIHGDFAGFPPTYLISGTRDALLSDTVRTHRKLRRAGVIADLHVYEGLAHADFALRIGSPEQAEHYAELDVFLDRHLVPR